MSTVEFHPDAAEEAVNAFSWYAERSERAAEGFLAELDDATKNISEFPDRYPKHIHGTRVFLLRRYPYLIVYKESDAKMEIVAVAHTRRKPGYWKKRVKKWGRRYRLPKYATNSTDATTMTMIMIVLPQVSMNERRSMRSPHSGHSASFNGGVGMHIPCQPHIGHS